MACLHDRNQLEAYIQGVVVASDQFGGSKVEEAMREIMETYKDSVFKDRHDGDPPVRGPFGEATIKLMHDAVPCKQRPFQLNGDKKQAWKDLLDKLIADGKLEDGVSSWNSPSFPVPTKTPGKWRLVEDYR